MPSSTAVSAPAETKEGPQAPLDTVFCDLGRSRSTSSALDVSTASWYRAGPIGETRRWPVGKQKSIGIDAVLVQGSSASNGIASSFASSKAMHVDAAMVLLNAGWPGGSSSSCKDWGRRHIAATRRKSADGKTNWTVRKRNMPRLSQPPLLHSLKTRQTRPSLTFVRRHWLRLGGIYRRSVTDRVSSQPSRDTLTNGPSHHRYGHATQRKGSMARQSSSMRPLILSFALQRSKRRSGRRRACPGSPTGIRTPSQMLKR